MPKLEQLQVDFISLVKRPANGKRIIWKDGDKRIQIPIQKVDETKRLVYGVVYSPESADSDQDWTSADEIEAAAYRFVSEGLSKNIDSDHDFQVGRGRVVESWLTKAGENGERDPLFPDEPVGSWIVAIKVDDDEAWERVVKGELTGLSLAGFAKRTEEDLPNTIKGAWERLKGLVKGVKERFAQREFEAAVGALSESLWAVLDNPEITDKKAAVIREVESFLSLIDQVGIVKEWREKVEGLGAAILEVKSKNREGANMSKEKKDQAPEAVTKEDVMELLKESVGEAVSEAVKGELEPVKERLEKLEKSPLLKLSLDDDGEGDDGDSDKLPNDFV